jgi:hypothetical protein
MALIAMSGNDERFRMALKVYREGSDRPRAATSIPMDQSYQMNSPVRLSKQARDRVVARALPEPLLDRVGERGAEASGAG